MDNTLPKPVKLAPGEWECGTHTALYDEHMRAYHVYDETGRRVTVVRRLTALARFAAPTCQVAA